MILNIPEELGFEINGDNIKFSLEGLSTNWMDKNDLFIKRIDENNLNNLFLKKHLKKEIEIKNILDEGIRFLKSEKYHHAIGEFDRVLFYDPCYGEALLKKSHALKGQKHFVKSLRYYRKAVKADDTLKDIEYYKNLLKLANRERDNFPKLKLNIYAGDEYFSRGEFEKAIESYNRALKNPSKFKDKILSKLLNKKAAAFLRLNNYENALDCFKQSLNIGVNDYAVFGEGFCQCKLGLEVGEGFKTRLNVTKKQMLEQVLALNDLGYLNDSFVICEYLWQNHFKVDEFYFKLADARRYLLGELGMDLGEIEKIYSLFPDKFNVIKSDNGND